MCNGHMHSIYETLMMFRVHGFCRFFKDKECQIQL